METYQVNVTRDEQIADRIEFCLKQDITIGTLKELMSLRIPYHPPASDIEILCNNIACPDDSPVSFFVAIAYLNLTIVVGYKQTNRIRFPRCKRLAVSSSLRR